MKKTLFLLLIIGLVLSVSSCKRSDVVDPPWDGPVGLNSLVEGLVNPAVMLIDGRIHTSSIYVKVTDSSGNPLANKTVFLEQLRAPGADNQVSWGYFSNNASTYQKATDANGEIRVTFYWPMEYYSYQMYIHAMLVVCDRAYQDLSVPQDYIALTMYRAFN
jgi:hypothetical protein